MVDVLETQYPLLESLNVQILLEGLVDVTAVGRAERDVGGFKLLLSGVRQELQFFRETELGEPPHVSE